MERIMVEFENALMQYTGMQREQAIVLAKYLLDIIEDKKELEG